VVSFAIVRILVSALRIAGWTLGAGFVALVGLYVTALAVNRHDRPPSIEAREFAALLDASPAVPDEDNADVYLLGFAAPRGEDPRRIGAERAAWIRRLRTDYTLGPDSDPYREPVSSVWSPERTAFFPQCPSDTRQRECFGTLSEAGTDVAAWLAGQDWMLARYAALLDYSSWRDIDTYDLRRIFRYADVSFARRAWFLMAWERARLGDAAGVRELLREDLVFWRLVLEQGEPVITKAVAAARVESHFALANVVLKRLPADRVGDAVPDSWREPISASERSARRAFASELRYVRNVIEAQQSGGRRYAAWAGVTPEPPTLSWRMARPLLRLQDSVNKRAHVLTAIADALAEPYRRIPRALEAARAVEARAGGWREAFYNPVGDTLMGAEGEDAYVDAAARFADIEGVRRAALLTAELRSRGVNGAGVPAAPAAPQSTQTYTREPFGWDAGAGEIVFVGIDPTRRGRHGFWY
jgi:hypothetical protein